MISGSSGRRNLFSDLLLHPFTQQKSQPGKGSCFPGFSQTCIFGGMTFYRSQTTNQSAQHSSFRYLCIPEKIKDISHISFYFQSIPATGSKIQSSEKTISSQDLLSQKYVFSAFDAIFSIGYEKLLRPKQADIQV
jgi:hypothetical protein